MLKNVEISQPNMTPGQLQAKQETPIDLVINHITNRIEDIESGNLMKRMQVFYPVYLPEAAAEQATNGVKKNDMSCVIITLKFSE